jgi:hypothetical protein
MRNGIRRMEIICSNKRQPNYDPERIIGLPEGSVGVWEKSTYDNTIIKSISKQEKSRFKNYSYTIAKHIFDCTSEQFITSSEFAYSTEDKVLLSRYNDLSSLQYLDVAPKSIQDRLMSIVCKKR